MTRADGFGPGGPIAFLGIGCRYPGSVNSPEDLWQLLSAESDAISQLPTDRGWNLDALFGPDPDAPRATYVRGGGFVENVADSDAAFFGITGRGRSGIGSNRRPV